jgi:phosphoribosylglycinamide formyltransferase-1
MARGEPGVPRRFTWREQAYEIAEVERSWKELSAASSGDRDRYVRRHVFQVVTTDGTRMRLTAVRGVPGSAPRWKLLSIL